MSRIIFQMLENLFQRVGRNARFDFKSALCVRDAGDRDALRLRFCLLIAVRQIQSDQNQDSGADDDASKK